MYETSFLPEEGSNDLVFTSIEKQGLATYTISLVSAFWELQQYSCRKCEPMKIPKLTSAPGNRTSDPMIAKPTLYLTTTDTIRMF